MKKAKVAQGSDELVLDQVQTSTNKKKAKDTVKAFVEKKTLKQIREEEIATMLVAWDGLRTTMQYRGLKRSMQAWVLKTIKVNKGLTATEIAKALSISVERVARICRALEDQGFIVRVPETASYATATYELSIEKAEVYAEYEERIKMNGGKGLKRIARAITEEIAEEVEA